MGPKPMGPQPMKPMPRNIFLYEWLGREFFEALLNLRNFECSRKYPECS